MVGRKAAEPRTVQPLIRLTERQMRLLESAAHLERLTRNLYVRGLVERPAPGVDAELKALLRQVKRPVSRHPAPLRSAISAANRATSLRRPRLAIGHRDRLVSHTPVSAKAPPSRASTGGVSPRSGQASRIVSGGTR